MKDLLEILGLIFGIAVLSLVLARANETATLIEKGGTTLNTLLRTLLLYDYKKG